MATSTLHIHPRVRQTGGVLRYEFDLVYSGSARTESLFYEMTSNEAPSALENFDGVLATIVFHAMAERRDVRLHGPATSAMLRNLTEFQRAWARWLPQFYAPVELDADSLVTPRMRARRSLSAFSGGVDSTFTLLRNDPRSTTPRYGVDTVVMVHGFDVALANVDALHELVNRTAPSRELTGARLCIVRTNSKELRLQRWEDSCGAQLAACLHLFSTDFSHALIGGSDAYDELWLPWGTNPVTDHLLSGGAMAIVHDGAAFCRTDKIGALAQRPEALRALKVCWQGKDQGRNCGVCEKCVRTQLNLLAVGVSSAPCFDRQLDPSSIRRLPIESELVVAELRSIIEYGERHHLEQDWFKALRRRVQRGRTRPGRTRTLRSRVRQSLARVRLLDAARLVRSKFSLFVGLVTRVITSFLIA
jgi:hypothetical protein